MYTCALCIVFPCGHNSPPFRGRHVFFAWLNAPFLLFIHHSSSSLVLSAHMLGMMPPGGEYGYGGNSLRHVSQYVAAGAPCKFLIIPLSFFPLSSTS